MSKKTQTASSDVVEGSLTKDQILKEYEHFLEIYNKDSIDKVWEQKSFQFRAFWKNRIMNASVKEISDVEIDEIVRILDKHGKGNTAKDPSVARVMIPQGVWRKMFIGIKKSEKLKDILYKMFEAKGDELIELTDSLYKANEGNKNSLTGASANAVNCMLFAYNPTEYCAAVSLKHRQEITDFYKFENAPDYTADSVGKKIYMSNLAILNGFKALGIADSPRVVSEFIYKSLKKYWHKDTNPQIEEDPLAPADPETEEERDHSVFYMEKELENFIIKNWDKTELGNKYDLIEEAGELVSQQYVTEIGKIDILVKDKATGEYVVIELKRDQTSDDTIGQLTRYMGWIGEKKSPKKKVKGLIIAGGYDDKLYYALKMVENVEVYIYKISFKLEEYKKK